MLKKKSAKTQAFYALWIPCFDYESVKNLILGAAWGTLIIIVIILYIFFLQIKAKTVHQKKTFDVVYVLRIFQNYVL